MRVVIVFVSVQVSNMVSSDFLWAFFCIIAVWIYMTIHLQSMILATVGMYEIVLAFPIAFFFYKGIFQVGSGPRFWFMISHGPRRCQSQLRYANWPMMIRMRGRRPDCFLITWHLIT